MGIYCSKCSAEKPKEEFNRSSSTVTGYSRYCRLCWNEMQKQWRDKHPDQMKTFRKNEYAKNKSVYMERAKKWLNEHPEYVTAYAEMHRTKNKALYNAYRAKRRATEQEAIPSWANRSKIDEIYKQAICITEETGVQHHVDHIVPIISPIVCGLHWEENLQVIPAFLNIAKGNRQWPNMPD